MNLHGLDITKYEEMFSHLKLHQHGFQVPKQISDAARDFHRLHVLRKRRSSYYSFFVGCPGYCTMQDFVTNSFRKCSVKISLIHTKLIIYNFFNNGEFVFRNVTVAKLGGLATATRRAGADPARTSVSGGTGLSNVALEGESTNARDRISRFR